MKYFMLFFASVFFSQCSHEIYLKEENYSRLDGWLQGEIHPSGFGAPGSPASNTELGNGREEVLDEICYDRQVRFFPISPSVKTVHSSKSSVYGDSIYNYGSSEKVQVVRGYTFICSDIDRKTPAYFLDFEKIICKPLKNFSPGNRRIEAIRKNEETDQCPDFKGWYRAKMENEDVYNLFVGKEGLASCKKLIGNYLDANFKDTNIFLMKQMRSCKKRYSKK